MDDIGHNSPMENSIQIHPITDWDPESLEKAVAEERELRARLGLPALSDGTLAAMVIAGRTGA